jgi:Fic family protein
MSEPEVEYTVEDALKVFEERDDPKEPFTSVEVAERMDCSRRTSRDRLKKLLEDGELKTKKTGARGRVYWR